MKLTRTIFRNAEDRVAVPRAVTPLGLTRKFIETGDERCPLAGLWTELLLSEPADDSERSMPAWEFFRLRRAFIVA